jgi:hypothetical protein
MSVKTRFNFLLDAVIFVAFLATTFTGLLLWLVLPDGPGGSWATWLGLTRYTWVDIHSWAGLIMLLGVAWHLVMHWDWIICVARRLLVSTSRQARINFSLDAVMFAAFFVVSLSGLIVWLFLPAGGYRGGRNPFYGATALSLTRHEWSDLHLWVGLAIMALALVHLVLHWGWITCTARRFARQAVSGLSCPAPESECLVDNRSKAV